MTPDPSAVGEPSVDVDIDDDRWAAALPDPVAVVEGAARAALGEDRPGGVAVLLTDDETVRALNQRFRSQDKPTNVLAFPAAQPDAGHLGDIALAFGMCDREAREQAKTLDAHLRHLVVHGVLHLMGYDHQDEGEAQVMESLERSVLAGIGVSDPYAADVRDPVHQDTPRHG